MYADIFRKLVAFLLWGALCAVWAGLALWLALTNYQSLVSALELWGTEKKGIGADELLGQVLSGIASWISDASLAHGFALGLAAGIGGALFLACKTLFDILNARDERAEYRRLGDAEREHNVGIVIRRRVREFAVILAPLAGAIWLDIELFKYRALNAAAGIDDPATASAETWYWSALPPEATQNFAVNLALNAGPIGYIALTALVSFLLEVGLQRLSETFSVLAQLIGGILGEKGGEQPEEIGYAQQAADDQVSSGTQARTTEAAAAAEDEVAASSAQAPGEPAVSEAGVPDRVPVIGGAEGETVTLADAQADQGRYRVHVATRSVWLRAHWDALHGVDQSEQERRAA